MNDISFILWSLIIVLVLGIIISKKKGYSFDVSQFRVLAYLIVILLAIQGINEWIKPKETLPVQTPLESICERYPNDTECIKLRKYQDAEFNYYNNPNRDKLEYEYP